MSTQNAIDAVRVFALQFQSVIDLANSVEGLASVENAVADATIRHEMLQKAISEAGEVLTDVQRRVDEATQKAESLVADAEAKAKSIVDAATAAAEGVGQDAINAAEQKVRDATSLAQSLAAQAAEKVSQIEQHTSTLADLEAKIANAKDQIAKMLGQ